MLQFNSKLSMLVSKYNQGCGNKINMLCNDNTIYRDIGNKYDVTKIKWGDNVKKCFTVIFVEGDDYVGYVNKLLKEGVFICLVVGMKFDFDKLVRSVMVNKITAISWKENGEKKSQYYMIVL